MTTTIDERIQPHNARPAAVWSAGGNDYDQISRGMADAIEHCVLRLNPHPGERILDLSTGTAAAELARVCRRNGRIALATWVSDANVYQMFKVMQRYELGTCVPRDFWLAVGTRV
jgi:hypothetical protein